MDHPALGTVTIIVPYYRNAKMLARQVHEWNLYPLGVQVILVDDGSPEPALPIVNQFAELHTRGRISVFCIEVDIPWNREGARNLGAYAADTEWIVHVDIDHVLPAEAAAHLLSFQPDPAKWYRFPRWRVGRADETRRKDAIPENQDFGKIHPHVDSYLVRRGTYWEVGGYDEDFSGCLGGGSEFLRRLEDRAAVGLLPDEIPLHVHTRSVIEDASDWSLSRDTSEGKRRQRAKRGTRPVKVIRFPWTQQL